MRLGGDVAVADGGHDTDGEEEGVLEGPVILPTNEYSVLDGHIPNYRINCSGRSYSQLKNTVFWKVILPTKEESALESPVVILPTKEESALEGPVILQTKVESVLESPVILQTKKESVLESPVILQTKAYSVLEGHTPN